MPSQMAGAGRPLGATSAIPQSAPAAQTSLVRVFGIPGFISPGSDTTSESSGAAPPATDSNPSPPPADTGSSLPPDGSTETQEEPPPIASGLPDTTPPEIVIQSPTSRQAHATNTPSLRLSGRAADNLGVSRVIWSAEAGASGVAEGTTQWQTAAIALQEGENVLRVTAVDAAGNLGQAQLAVRLDTVVPSVRITFPSHGAQFGPEQP